MALSTVTQYYDGTSWASEDGGFGGRYYNRGGGTQSACISATGRHSSSVATTSFLWNGTSWSTGNDSTYGTGEGCGNGSTSSAILGPGSSDQDMSASYDGTCWSNNPAFLYLTQAAGVIGNGERAIIAGGLNTSLTKSSYWDGTAYSYTNDILAANSHLVGIGTLGRNGGIIGSSYVEELNSPTVKFVGV